MARYGFLPEMGAGLLTLGVLLGLVAPGCSRRDRAPTGAAPAPVGPKASGVERRSIVIRSRVSGTSVTTRLPDGSFKFSYHHVENARGPKFEAKARIAADGTLSSFSAKGLHTLGTPIEERFRVEGGRARWRSREESGQKRLTAPAFYYPIAPLPEVIGFLFTALRRAGGRIALLPRGEARLEGGERTTARVNGRAKKLVAWAITGLDFTPLRLWADESGAFFGTVHSWYSAVPVGWEKAIPDLLAVQKRLETARDRRTYTRLARRPPEAGLAVIHARLFDVERKRVVPDQTVIVTRGKIAAVGSSRTTKVPTGALIIDARGQTLLPGLWDMHAHITQADGALNIASGVTTVRDLANDPDRLDDYKRRFDAGLAIGPRVLRSGFIEGRGANAAASKITAETRAEARAAVAFYARRGYEGIKIYNSIKPALVPVLTRLAHERGMRVSGHIPKGMLAEDTIRAGYDEIQHVNMLFLNFLANRSTDTNTKLRFTLVAEKAPGLDLRSKPVKAFFRLLLRKKTVVDPTLVAFEDMFVARPGHVYPSVASLVDRLPAQVQRWFLTGGLPVPKGKDAHYRQAFVRLLDMVKALHDAKIPIVAGTDWIAGLGLHHELGLYVRAGIRAADVLRLATLDSARVMKHDRRSGSVAAGKDADFFLVDGDPVARIKDLRKVTITVRGGVVFNSAEVYATVGVRP